MKKKLSVMRILLPCIIMLIIITGCENPIQKPPGSYYLTIIKEGNGMTFPLSGNSYIVEHASEFNISATPDTGNHFVNWTVENGTGVAFDNATEASTTVTLNKGNATIQANFIRGYKKQFTINGSQAGAVTDYQMKLTVHRGSGVDSANHVYLDNYCQADFDDIRFTTSGNNKLDYWRQEYMSGDYAIFWIEFDQIPQGLASGVFYLCYGNADAEYTGNGLETFVFFDDFEDGDMSEWTRVNAHGSGISSVQAIDNNSYYIYDNTSNYGTEISKYDLPPQVLGYYEFSAYPTFPDQSGVYISTVLGGQYLIHIHQDGRITWYGGPGGGTYHDFSPPVNIPLHQWTRIGLEWNCTTSTIELFVNGEHRATGNVRQAISNVHTIKFGSGHMNAIGESGYIDNLIFCKRIDPAPTWGNWE